MNDADIEMADLEARANHESALRKRGVCAHGSCIGSRPCVCRNCGKEFDSFDALLEERADILS